MFCNHHNLLNLPPKTVCYTVTSDQGIGRWGAHVVVLHRNQENMCNTFVAKSYYNGDIPFYSNTPSGWEIFGLTLDYIISIQLY